MDSPHFTSLCFLLLTIAAPRPSIAMPLDNSAEGTQNSSFGKTKVSVYCCKNCESNMCKSSDYTQFVKIGETESEIFSNEVIQLVTSETHIIMCFQQENTSYEGIYAIVWEKALGIGESCGILNSGASSENVRGNIVKICCKAETNISVPKPLLECYAEEEELIPTITDEENPDDPHFSGSKKISTVIVTPLLIIGLCAAVAMYCVRQNRNARGPVIVFPQLFPAVGKNERAPDMKKFTHI